MKRRKFCQSMLVVPGLLAVNAKGGTTSGDAQKGSSAPKQLRHDFFDPKTVQEIRFEIDARDWRRLRSSYLGNDYYPCSFVWNGTSFGDVSMRSHGSTTRNSEKPALRIDMNGMTGKSSFKNVNSFVLGNLVEDSSFLRNYLAMRVFHKMGIPAPRLTFSRIFINNRYQGLYSLGEEMDKRFRSRTLNERGGRLYRSSASNPFGPDTQVETKEACGELFRCENHPKKQKLGKLTKMIQTFHDAPAEDFAVSVGQYIDWKHFMCYLACEAFVDDRSGLLGDSDPRSFCLYRFNSSGTIWLLPRKKSRSFLSVERSVWDNTAGNLLTKRALADPSLSRLYALSLVAVITTVGGEGDWLDSVATARYEATRAEALEDPFKPSSNADYEAAAAQVLDFARRRAPSLSK